MPRARVAIVEEAVDKRGIADALLPIAVGGRRVHEARQHVEHRADEQERAQRIRGAGRFDASHCGTEEGLPQAGLDFRVEVMRVHASDHCRSRPGRQRRGRRWPCETGDRTARVNTCPTFDALLMPSGL